MSFGFGLGDFLAVGELAWALYKDVYLVAQAAPQEVDQLEKQLSTLRNSLDILKEDFNDENSILHKAGPERLKAAEDILKGVYETLQDLQTITTKYKKKFDSSRGKLKRGWDKIGFAITDAKEIDGIRNKESIPDKSEYIAYHNGLMTLLLTAIGNTSLQRLESSNSNIEKGINKIMNHVGITSTPMMSKRPGMEDEVFNASISANLLRYAEIEKPWASIGIFEWIQAGKWWLLRYQSELEGQLSDSKTLSLETYIHLVKSAWILTDLIILHPQRNHLNEAISAGIEMLVKAITEEFDRLESRNIVIPSLDDIEDDSLRIWEKHDGIATLQPGQRRKEGPRTWIMPNDLIIYQKFAKHQNRNSSSSKMTAALVLLLVDKKTKGVRVIIHDQSWQRLAEYTDSALKEKKDTITVSPDDPRQVLFDSHGLSFATRFDAEIFHGIITVESHAIRPYNAYFKKSSIQMHHTFYLLHGLVRCNKQLVQHFYTARMALPPAIISEAERALDEAVIQHSVSFCDGAGEVTPKAIANCQSDVLIRKVISSEFSEIAGLLAALRGIPVSETMIQSKLCPREVLRERRTDMFKLLLDSDPRIVYDYSDESPDDLLSFAISLGLIEEVKLIAAAHQRLNGLEAALTRTSQTGGFRTVLSWVAQCWNPEVFETLYGGFTTLPGNVVDKDKRYPVYWAAENGNTKAVELLLSPANSKSNIAGGSTRTPLHLAAKAGHESTVRFLLSKPEVHPDARDFNQETPLMVAAEAGHLEIVKILANHPRVDINHKSTYSSPLTKAATYGHSEVVQFLLSLDKIDPNSTNCVGKSALSMAATFGYDAVVDLLIERTTQKPDREGRLVLSCAAEKGHINVVRLLAQRNPADATHRDKFGRTPLHYAVQSPAATSCVTYLLSLSNVDPNCKSNQDATPLQLAVQSGNIDSIRILLSRKDVDVNWKASSRPNDRTALMLSAIKAREDIAELLLQREEIDVNLKDKDFQATALHHAAVHPDGEGVLRRILAHPGANPTLLDEAKETPLKSCLDSGTNSEKKDRRIKLLEDAIAAWERPQTVEIPTVASEVLDDLKPKLTAVHVEDIQIEEKMGLTGTATTITFTTAS